MINFKSGVHTIEFQTTNQLKLSDLPAKYKGAVQIEENKRYRLTLPKIGGVPEYSPPADTQEVIKEAFATFADMGAGYCTTTRIDYRFDDHDGTYSDNLSFQTIIVNLIAFVGGMYDRRVFYLDGNGVTTSVRCMPDKDDHSSRYGIEYYDKPKQAKTDEYGNARLELRRLNMEGETVVYVLREWSDMLKSITKKEYLAMLEAHVQLLQTTKQDGEKASDFIRRMRSKLIGYEEWNMLWKLNGKHTKDYPKVKHLPKWEQVKTFIDDLTAQLDEALFKSRTISQHPKKVIDEMPF